MNFLRIFLADQGIKRGPHVSCTLQVFKFSRTICRMKRLTL
jgi:hypothetical protein